VNDGSESKNSLTRISTVNFSNSSLQESFVDPYYYSVDHLFGDKYYLLPVD
jgi:hypothetical protein